MPHINYDRKEVAFKVVYFGPGMSGKTTNLYYIHRMLAEHQRGEMITLDTAEERTLFFDFFPLDLGSIAGYTLRFNLYTVPGQVYYEASRRLILDGADGVVFVADSRQERLEDNLESFIMMEDNLRYYGMNPKTFPLVLQYNKRDCDPLIGLGTLEQRLNVPHLPAVSSVATKGTGVMETIRIVCRRVILRFQV